MIPLQHIERMRHAGSTRVTAWLDRHQHRTVLIYSEQWHAYWRSGGAGYTEQLHNAGVYTLADAFKHTRGAGPEKRIYFVFVDAAFAQAQQILASAAGGA